MNVFKLEEFLGRYEFSAPYLLCCSDAQSTSMQAILDMANKSEMHMWETLQLGYTEVSGLPKLREQIAASLYPTLDASNILCFAGAEDGIFCALYTLCEEGDHIIALTPCYQSLIEIPALKKVSLTAIDLQKDNNWRIDLEAITNAIRPNTKLIVINFPHNPTGQVITQEELDKLVDICREKDIWLFSDEVYRLLGKPERPWAKPAAQCYEKAVSLGVMSKAFGMAGLRVGWIACQDTAFIKKMEYIKHYTSICNSAPSEILSLISLRNQDIILARNNKIIVDNLTLLDTFMQQYASLFEWVRPQGGCVGFIEYKREEPVDSLCDRLVKQKGVLLMPAFVYDYPYPYFRIGFGRSNMYKALDLFKTFLEEDK